MGEPQREVRCATQGGQALLDTVRSTGAKNIVVVGGLDYAYELDAILNAA